MLEYINTLPSPDITKDGTLSMGVFIYKAFYDAQDIAAAINQLIVQVRQSYASIFMLTSNGEVWMLTKAYITRVTLPEVIVSIDAVYPYYSLLSENGRRYIYNNNRCEEVSVLEDDDVKQALCFSSHIIMLTKKGMLYRIEKTPTPITTKLPVMKFSYPTDVIYYVDVGGDLYMICNKIDSVRVQLTEKIKDVQGVFADVMVLTTGGELIVVKDTIPTHRLVIKEKIKSFTLEGIAVSETGESYNISQLRYKHKRIPY